MDGTNGRLPGNSMNHCDAFRRTASICCSFTKSSARPTRRGFSDLAAASKQAGKIRYIGFTGYKSPAMHLQMLETGFSHQLTFDAVQMPLNVMDAHFDSFEKKVLPVLLKHKIGVLGMKPMGDRIILESKTASPVECLHYALSLPTSVVITGCDSLPKEKILGFVLNRC